MTTARFIGIRLVGNVANNSANHFIFSHNTLIRFRLVKYNLMSYAQQLHSLAILNGELESSSDLD